MGRLAVGLMFVVAAGVSLGCFLYSQSGHSGSSEESEPRDAFAADRAQDVVKEAGAFDAARAMGYLKKVCALGPRISGSDGMMKQQELLQKHFEEQGGKVQRQRFTVKQRSRKQPTEMANLIVSWHPDRPRRLILCSHYDTRPIADQEPDPRNWTKPFISANDGGSGVALLMELAHHMKDLKLQVGVDFVLFDGEEYVFNNDEEGDLYFFGSQHFAKEYRGNRQRQRYLGAVLLDMIAGKNPRFAKEQHSWAQAGPLVQEIWGIAAQQRAAAFRDEVGEAIRDDHLALNAAGIPAVDVIDFNYMYNGHWHKLSDVPENCSGDTLAQVARVLMVWLQRVK